ncbi:MAG: hypothetical protein AAF740_01800 [Bacteroidota bacterium]
MVLQTNQAQKRFKALAADVNATKEEVDEAEKQFLTFDNALRKVNKRAKDGRRDVGRYEIATKKLNNTLDNLAKATVVVKVFEQVLSATQRNSTAAGALDKAFGAVAITFDSIVGLFTNKLPEVKDAFTNTFDSIGNAVSQTFIDMRVKGLQAINVLGNFDEDIAALKKESAALGEELDSTKGLGSIFSDLTKEIEENVKRNNQLVDTTLAYRRQIIGIQKEINGLIGAQAKLQAAADNENNSLVERISFQEQLIESTNEIAALELKMAEKREELALENARINKNNIEAQEAAAEATATRVNVEIQNEQERLAQKTELATLERDLVEQQLDFQIDDFDNRKKNNEELLKNEKLTFEERKRIAEENIRLEQETFEAQVGLINDRLKKQGKAQLDIEKLVSESSSRQIAEQAINAGLSEQLTTRLLEIIRERRTQNQEVLKTQEELNDAEKTANQIVEETILKQEALKALKDDEIVSEEALAVLQQKTLSLAIQNLEMRIALSKEGSEERIRLESELTDKLLEQESIRLEGKKKKIAEEEKARKEAIERQERVQEAAFATIESFNDRRLEKLQTQIDTELSVAQEREDKLRELAERGLEDADNNLALNQKRQAELLRQQEEARKRAEQEKFLIAALDTYTSYLAQGETVVGALGKTATSTSLLRQIVQNLPGFHKGTENTGSTGIFGISDQYGPITGFTHRGERVLNEDENNMIPSWVDNTTLATVAHQVFSAPSSTANTSIDVKAVKELEKSIVDLNKQIANQPKHLKSYFDAVEECFVHVYEKKGLRFTERDYVGGVFGS